MTDPITNGTEPGFDYERSRALNKLFHLALYDALIRDEESDNIGELLPQYLAMRMLKDLSPRIGALLEEDTVEDIDRAAHAKLLNEYKVAEALGDAPFYLVDLITPLLDIFTTLLYFQPGPQIKEALVSALHDTVLFPPQPTTYQENS